MAHPHRGSCSVVKNPPVLQELQETQIQSLGWEDPLEEDMATHSIFLPGESHGQRTLVGYSPYVHRVRHDWSDWACVHTHIWEGCNLLCLLISITITPKQPDRIPSVLAPWAQSSWHIKLAIKPGVWAGQSRLLPAAFLKDKEIISLFHQQSQLSGRISL